MISLGLPDCATHNKLFVYFHFQVVQVLAPILILKIKLMEVQMMQYGTVSPVIKKIVIALVL